MGAHPPWSGRGVSAVAGLGVRARPVQVTIVTGPQRVAATDAAAYITLIGEWRTSEKIPLLKAAHDMQLQRRQSGAGNTETFTVTSQYALLIFHPPCHPKMSTRPASANAGTELSPLGA